MINSRLFDWYGIDTKKNLQIKNICPKPFDTVLIDWQGSCYLCECTAWLPQSVGNLHLQSLETILNSSMADTLRTSILDNSYRYCNNAQCSYLLDIRNNNMHWNKIIPPVQINNIRLAIDNSCNLSCPSCRKNQIFEKRKSYLEKRYRLADKIINFIQSQKHTINVHVGSDGDPFASLVYRYFIKHSKKLSNIKFTLQTNGLLVKNMYQKHKEMFDRLEVLNVSIDGAHKNTYERLRRGGSYQKILENLQTIKNLKKDYKFKFILHFVVQLENYKEMIPMIELAEFYNAEKVWFNRITDWNTYENFTLIDILDQKNEHYDKCIEEIKKVRNIKTKVKIEMPTLISKKF